MFIIRTAQLEELRRVLTLNLHRRLAAHLRHRFPAQTTGTSDSELTALVNSAAETARGYGIVAEADLRRYLEFVIRYGPAFGAEPKTEWAGDILRRGDMDAESRLSLLDEYDLFGHTGSSF